MNNSPSNIFQPLILLVRFHENSQVFFLLHATGMNGLTLPMLRLLYSRKQGHKDFRKPSKPYHVGIHWIALAENSQMSTHLPGFQPFFRVFSSYCNGQNQPPQA